MTVTSATTPTAFAKVMHKLHGAMQQTVAMTKQARVCQLWSMTLSSILISFTVQQTRLHCCWYIT